MKSSTCLKIDLKCLCIIVLAQNNIALIAKYFMMIIYYQSTFSTESANDLIILTNFVSVNKNEMIQIIMFDVNFSSEKKKLELFYLNVNIKYLESTLFKNMGWLDND